MTRATVSADGETITVHIPLTFRRRGGRKRVITSDGAEWAPRPRVDNAMVKALARAFRWRKWLDTGVHATIEDLARTKGVHDSYVSRVLRLTLLATDRVETILDGRQPAGLQLKVLWGGFPLEWDGQRELLVSRERACAIFTPGAGRRPFAADHPMQPPTTANRSRYGGGFR